MKFNKWKRNGWNKELDFIAGGRSPDKIDFPWGDLHRCMRDFVKKKSLRSQAQVDKALLAIIDSHETKAVALAACARLMSDAVCTDCLVKELRVSRSGETAYRHYLRCIVAVGHVKASVASSVEVKRAQFFLGSTSTRLSISDRLANALSLVLPAPSSPGNFLQNDITQLTRELCCKFTADLSVKVSAGDLEGAYGLSRWLLRPVIADALESNDPGVRTILNDLFPTWRAWVAWQPNLARKESWTKYSHKAPRVVKDLLRLEGADLIGELGSEQSTLQRGLVLRCSKSSCYTHWIGSVRLTAERSLSEEGKSLFELLELLANLIDYAITADHSFTELLAHFCMKQMISYEDVELLECVRVIDNVNFTKATRRFLARGKWPFQCILDVIPSLGDVRVRKLKEKMKVDIVRRISNHLTALRETIFNLMRSESDLEEVAIEIMNLTRNLQSSSWLLVELEHSVQELIHYPPDASKLKNLHAIRKLMRIDPQLYFVELEKRIDVHVYRHLAAGPAPSELERDLIDTMTNIFSGLENIEHRALVVFIAGFSCENLQFACDCIRDIGALSHPWISHMSDALFLMDGARHVAIQASISLLAHHVHGAARQRLRVILFKAIHKNEKRTFAHIARTLAFDDWMELLRDIRVIFQDDGTIAAAGQEVFFNLDLHTWSQQIARHPASVRRLESALGRPSSLQTVLKCFRSYETEFLALLETIDQVENKQLRNHRELVDLVLQEIRIPKQISSIKNTLLVLLDVEEEMLEDFCNLIRAQRQVSPSFANLVLAHLRRSRGQQHGVQPALIEVAKLFKVDINSFEDPAQIVLEQSAQLLRQNYSQLIEEARRLENLRLSLQVVVPQEVWSLLKKLNIERPPILIDLLSGVPESLQSVIEGVAGHEIEMRFPVTSLTKMQRLAIKVNDTENFVVRLILDNDGRPRGFCVHLSSDGKSPTDEVYHIPSLFEHHSERPMKQECPGRFNRGAFQLSTLLWHHLRFDFISLERTYKHVSTGLSDWGRGCMMCGGGQTRLRRATTCCSRTCQESYLRAPVEVLLADIWQDPAAVDLLLASVHAVAAISNLSLLPKVPAVDPRMILRTLKDLPRISDLAKHLSVCRRDFCNEFRLEQALLKFCKSWSDSICLSKCLVWMCNSYRGYLTSASRSQRIPWFGDNQFLLVNSTPELEASFSQHMSTSAGKSEILFHGTSMDRLYAILCQGLRVQSGTNLQRHGAAYGPGIYMADEPLTAWGYTVNSKGGWKSSSFQESRVLLGCELAGEKPKPTSGIQVIKDPSRLAVRYVFILKADARMPAAKDIQVPMASMFQNFRSRLW